MKFVSGEVQCDRSDQKSALLASQRQDTTSDERSPSGLRVVRVPMYWAKGGAGIWSYSRLSSFTPGKRDTPKEAGS